MNFWEELCGTNLARSLGITEHTPESLRKFDEAYFGLYPYLKGYVQGLDIVGRDVLEIGLGYGTLGQWMASGAGSYMGVDLASAPVEMMKLRGCEAIRGSAHNLPFEGEKFDIVVSIGTFHHTGDIQRCIREVHRVLRPGGKTLIMVYSKRLFHRERDVNSRGESPPTLFVTQKELREMLSDFSHCVITRENWKTPYNLFRNFFLSTIGKLDGLDFYVTAVKA